MISGINHITFSTANLEKSLSFYNKTLGFKLVASWNQGAYLLAGELWFCLILDDTTRKKDLPEYTHIALSISSSNYNIIRDNLKNAGVKFWKVNSSEGDSLYILDPDGHKLELHIGDIESRLASVRKRPYEGMKFFV